MPSTAVIPLVPRLVPWVVAMLLLAHAASGWTTVTVTGKSSRVSSTINPNVDDVVSSLLYQEHEKMLVARGAYEGTIMAHHTLAIAPNVVKGAGRGGGFGASGGKTSLLKAEAKAHAKVLRETGVVRIDHVLPPALADEMRQFVNLLRQDTVEKVASGELNSRARFSDVLLRENRCDLTLPFANTLVADSLAALLQQSPVGATLAELLTKDAVLHELSCLISDPGSHRQVMHPDTPCAAGQDAVLYTCFVALQDVSIDMGPTTWMPGTHTLEAHRRFKLEQVTDGEDLCPKDALLQAGPVVLGLLPKGSCGIYDSRLLHCGGANRSQDKSRAIFYFSFKNPKVLNPGNPPSIRHNLINQWTLISLDKELTKHTKGKSTVFVGGRAAFD